MFESLDQIMAQQGEEQLSEHSKKPQESVTNHSKEKEINTKIQKYKKNKIITDRIHRHSPHNKQIIRARH